MKRMMNSLFLVSVILAVCLGRTSTLVADNAVAEAKFKQAETLFEQRADLTKTDAAIPLLEQATKEATQELLKYQILILHSQCIYWKGTHAADNDAKKALFEAGRLKADEARKLNPDWAEAQYHYAVNLGRWAEANGVIQSLFKKKEIMQVLESLFDKDTSDGKPGEAYAEYGADRILGRLYFKLPGFAGGSLEAALEHLSKAYLKGKENGTNILYYAEALYSSSPDDKAKAKAILDEFLAANPKTYNPKRVPEIIEEYDQAKKLRQEMGQ